ncbi:heme-binding domain-containing protein [Candidatus Latescibacterota bacterium]
MKRPLKIAILSIIVFTLVIQLIRPERTSTELISQTDISRHVEIPGDVKDLLRVACNDCHSDNTVWPWYSNFSPVSWLIAYDINSGKERLNFSEWGDYSDMQKTSKFVMIDEMVESGKMPILPYKMMHKEARLTDDQRKAISEWAEKSK